MFAISLRFIAVLPLAGQPLPSAVRAFHFPCKYQEKAGREAHGAPIYRGAAQRGPHFQELGNFRMGFQRLEKLAAPRR
jgi:hypothetical protein